jgi:uncharacterized membrane protein
MNDTSPKSMNIKPALVVGGVIVAAMFVLSWWAWGRLPAGAQIPVHFDATGTPDRYGGRFEGLLLMPLISIGLLAMFAVIPRVEPRRQHLLQSSKAYFAVWMATMVVLAGVHAAAVLTALDYEVNITMVVLGLIGVMFVVIGNYLGKVRSNFLMGVRTPWTLTSDLSWNKTHRLAGRLFILLGVVIVAAAFLDDPVVLIWVVLGGVLALLAVTVVYSYLVWKSDPDKQVIGREETPS